MTSSDLIIPVCSWWWSSVAQVQSQTWWRTPRGTSWRKTGSPTSPEKSSESAHIPLYFVACFFCVCFWLFFFLSYMRRRYFEDIIPDVRSIQQNNESVLCGVVISNLCSPLIAFSLLPRVWPTYMPTMSSTVTSRAKMSCWQRMQKSN